MGSPRELERSRSQFGSSKLVSTSLLSWRAGRATPVLFSLQELTHRTRWIDFTQRRFVDAGGIVVRRCGALRAGQGYVPTGPLCPFLLNRPGGRGEGAQLPAETQPGVLLLRRPQ